MEDQGKKQSKKLVRTPRLVFTEWEGKSRRDGIAYVKKAALRWADQEFGIEVHLSDGTWTYHNDRGQGKPPLHSPKSDIMINHPVHPKYPEDQRRKQERELTKGALAAADEQEFTI